MLRTPLLDVLGIEHPVIQAGMGRYGGSARLAAAVSSAGAIGSIGAAKRSADELRGELEHVRSLTDRPFIVSFTKTWLQLHPECLDCALAARPRAISVSQGLPGAFVRRIQGAGVLVMTQVQTVEQARLAADEGADIVVAQGAEAGGVGGFGGRIGISVLVPMLVDALSPLPVVAAGGITDGRGVASALVLGAAGVMIGTRFLASVEATVGDDWKQRLVDVPPGGEIEIDAPGRAATGDGWRQPEPLDGSLSLGQGVGAIRSVETAAAIVEDLIRGTEESLARSSALVVESTAI